MRRRRPTRRHDSFSRCQPVAFSAFARFVARVAASGNMVKRVSSPIKERKDLFEFPGNGSIKHKMKEKIVESESSSEEEDNEKTVQADFAFFDPKADDFHGVKVLLQNYLDDKQWDLSGFVDLILGQTTVGTVVKIEDQEDDGLFSVVTVLNLDRYKKNKCIEEINNFLLKVCEKVSGPGEMRRLLKEQAHDVGLLVSQHVVNLPPQLLPPLYDALFDEVLWATEDEPTDELRDSFCFKFYIILTKIYEHKNAKDGKGTSNSCSDEPIIYIKPEDEIFHKLSAWSFTFPLRTQQGTAYQLRNYRLAGLVLVVEAKKIPRFRKELKSLINEG